MKLLPHTTKGQGQERAKLHKQLHVPDDIKRNGTSGLANGPTEDNHIASVKITPGVIGLSLK